MYTRTRMCSNLASINYYALLLQTNHDNFYHLVLITFLFYFCSSLLQIYHLRHIFSNRVSTTLFETEIALHVYSRLNRLNIDLTILLYIFPPCLIHFHIKIKHVNLYTFSNFVIEEICIS